jgi:hypothetical protein
MGFRVIAKVSYPLWIAFIGCLAISVDGLPEQGPPPPAAVPPNGSVIVATVLKVRMVPAESVCPNIFPKPLNRSMYSIQLKIRTAEPKAEGLQQLARVGMTIDALYIETPPSDLTGKTVRANLALAGDTRGVQWIISDIRMARGGK